MLKKLRVGILIAIPTIGDKEMIAEALVLHRFADRDKVNQTRTADLFGRMFECLHLLYAVSWAVQFNLLLKFRSSDWPDEEEPD